MTACTPVCGCRGGHRGPRKIGGPFLWLNTVLFFYPEPEMGNKIVTEADRKFTPPLPTLPGVTLRTGGRGQRVSLERGVATRSKKNPGKRSKKGG